jgi:hypothetical protein
MGWFGRKRGGEAEPETVDSSTDAAALAAFEGVVSDDGKPLRPVVEAIGEAERARIEAAVAAVEGDGVDIDDLESLGAGYDVAYRSWADAPEDGRPDHAQIVERYSLAVGEYLNRHTDLDWQIVTDVFGTDLAVAGGFKGDFVIVPHNLVAARWMRGETGWLPGVVGHLVRRRSR